jgi:glycosyltransferase involved in cell wall biosynthesis
MISIIIPTLNEENYLRRTLENLRQMKATRYEIIISDGKSTDGTLETAKKYADKVFVYSGQARQTISNGRNLGAKEAAGDFLVFIDSDVIVPNPDDFFQKAVKFFEADEKLAGITTMIKVYPESATLTDKIFSWITNATHIISNSLLKKGSASGEFQMIRKSFFDQAGGFNDALVTCEDIEMFERLARIGKTRMIKELTIFHSGRRAHKIGWIKLMSIWVFNFIHFHLFKKAYTKEWKPIR